MPSTSTGGEDDIPENEKINLDLDAIDHDGEEVHVFHWEPSFNEFEIVLADIGNDARKQAPNTPVDIIATGIRSMATVMVEGHLTELNTYSDSLDLSKV